MAVSAIAVAVLASRLAVQATPARQTIVPVVSMAMMMAEGRMVMSLEPLASV
jgi:hypothetical protein